MVVEKSIYLRAKVLHAHRHFVTRLPRISKHRYPRQDISPKFVRSVQNGYYYCKKPYLALSTNVFYLHNTTGCGEINFFMAEGN